MLLAFDEIYYLLPKNLAEFHDLDGSRRHMVFPLSLQGSELFTVRHFVPDDSDREVIQAAAQADMRNSSFRNTIRTIPHGDRIYTWQVVNADGDIAADGQSPNLLPREFEQAHSLLLNKFLLAADKAHCIPITGKPYIHGLLSAKLRQALVALRENAPDFEPRWLNTSDVGHGVVVDHLIQTFLSDDQLARLPNEDVVQFKAANREVFERFSFTVRRLVAQVECLPSESPFEREVEELMSTEVWAQYREAEDALRDAWGQVFREGVGSAAKTLIRGEVATFAGTISLGVLPFTLAGLTHWSAVAAGLAAGWMLTRLLDLSAKRRAAERNGLYYLMKFQRAA